MIIIAYLFLSYPINFAKESDLLSIIYRSGLIAKIVLAVLLFFSIVSWAIIIDKYLTIKKAKTHSRFFLKLFKGKKNFKEIASQCLRWKKSPFTVMFLAANEELQYQIESSKSEASNPYFKINIEAILRELVRVANSEVERLQSQLSFLATTASATPFIGLFGTVIGIIKAFEEIGKMGSTDLSIVAPGIAEALIATAMGLAAAIPAVIGYNHFVNQIKSFANDMDDFTTEMVNIIERLYLRK